MIDFHCHLDLYPDAPGIVSACRDRALYVLSVTTTPSAWSGTVALAAGAPRIQTALGLHPQLAHERKGEVELFERLLPNTRYVGEIGLDGSPELQDHWGDQVMVFERILAACSAAGGRVLSVHSRRAAGAVLDALEAKPASGTAVLHWFSGTVKELARAVRLGCWFSVGPSMLSNEKGRTLARHMPRDRVVTESDGPFATIKRRQAKPWDVIVAVGALADLWGVPSREAEQVLLMNLRRLVTPQS